MQTLTQTPTPTAGNFLTMFPDLHLCCPLHPAHSLPIARSPSCRPVRVRKPRCADDGRPNPPNAGPISARGPAPGPNPATIAAGAAGPPVLFSAVSPATAAHTSAESAGDPAADSASFPEAIGAGAAEATAGAAAASTDDAGAGAFATASAASGAAAATTT
ncbi:hypothetical protein BDK51DRAFT_44618 [Blyttiomyces helicus]|uniref:Uncharacterized protein n=1 Tax=Blyttiomyces helicus TaxID=388810 RepID=A0A4P9WCG4_9FUNG|nr:hypothetical protein BDK51DRAFT_44618 [Blyttiomyces helicus]|eukprot:RKO89293.1 hypothetical protein BDK51DRAFT_44618 [Blyttiomyces helicus]